jgi:hypothetical protein
MNTSLSIFARALATENLSFSFDANADTASFDTKSRHLVMPVWDVSDTLQTMLVAHEISHALWTPHERSQELLTQAEKDGYCIKLLHHIANVIEDVRIEKLMKAKYPGTRRDFFLGYKEIVDADLFKFKSMDLKNTNIINRLNLHFKWGVPGFLPIDLNADENEIAMLVDAVQTFDQGFELAKHLYKHPSMKDMREKYEAQAEKQKKSSGTDGDQDDDGTMSQTDLSDSNLGMVDMPCEFGRKNGEKFHATTLTISPVVKIENNIITTDEMLESYEDAIIGNPYGNPTLDLTNYRSFVKESDAFVRQLVAQFERRKAADEIRRERPKQTGMLNLDRLHQFRTHDDIFLSKIIKQDGKNHGIVFLIDFSGSMTTVLDHCILQVFQLVWFCEKAKIPFEVFGFTNMNLIGNRGKEEDERHRKFCRQHSIEERYVPLYPTETQNPRPDSIVCGNTRLISLASSADSPAKRERLLAFIYESSVQRTRSQVFSLGGTPTVEAMILTTQYMKKWVQDNNVQIPTLMLVTDGQPNGVSLDPTSPMYSDVPYQIRENMSLMVRNDILQTMTRIDNKEHDGMGLGNVVVSVMLDDLRQTMNARTVGMYVGGRTFNDSLYRGFCLLPQDHEQMDRIIEQARKNGDWRATISLRESPRYEMAQQQYMSEGCIILPTVSNPGYDAFFLIKTPKIVKDEEAIVESGTFVKVKNTFVKTMGKRAGSRVFLSKYVDIVAGQPVPKNGGKLYDLPAHNGLERK